MLLHWDIHRNWLAVVQLALFLLFLPVVAGALVCGPDSLRQKYDIRVTLCSPEPNEVDMKIVPEGLQISWDAPPRGSTTYVSDVLARCKATFSTSSACSLSAWEGVPGDTRVPGIEIRGTYLALTDRRIQLDVLSIGAGTDSVGVFGQDLVRVSWLSIYGGSTGGSLTGSFLIDATNVDQPLPFLRIVAPAPPDTTVLAGLRVVFHAGTPVQKNDAAYFDVEDFEGFHVWRWGANPNSQDYEAIGEYSKLADTRAPRNAWPVASPFASRFTFLDRDVFDGFTYYYAITSYDQGFNRAIAGTTLALKFDSPISPGGPTQIRYEFRRPPAANFQPITAVPNPFRDSDADPRRAETNSVFFTNAPPRGTLYIFTMAGDLVLQRDHTLPNIGTITWDTRNGNGQKVASGVYIYKIVDLVSGQQSYGRLAIIR